MWKTKNAHTLSRWFKPLVYKYFKLNSNEIVHIKDTSEIISPSASPNSPRPQPRHPVRHRQKSVSNMLISFAKNLIDGPRQIMRTKSRHSISWLNLPAVLMLA